MTIQILNKETQTLKQELVSIIEKDNEIEDESEFLPRSVIINIKNLLSDSSIENLFKNLKDMDYFKKFDYETLSELFELFELLYTNTKKIKDEVDIDLFLKKGYRLDIKKLKAKFDKNKLHKEFPNFNFKKLDELYKKPPETLPTYYDENKFILVDDFVFRKYLIAIIQMVFNHMDLLVCTIGPEGSGKSTKISQDMLLCHHILTQLNIINYDFDIKEIWFDTLPKFRLAEDKYFNQHFRIIGLDEGNELNRQDWKDEEVRTFFQRLRRERYNRRLKFICLPVLGEMIPNIVLSRMNFIFDMLNKNEIKTGTLFKGDYEFYIIPRGDKIYSPKYKKVFTRQEIKQKMYTNLKDKEYLKGMPKDIIVKTGRCNGTWGFKESDYIKELKESAKTFTVTKGITFGPTELFMFYKANITVKKMGIKSNDIRYASLAKMVYRINNYFYNDPDTMFKYDAIYKKKLEDKEERE